MDKLTLEQILELIDRLSFQVSDKTRHVVVIHQRDYNMVGSELFRRGLLTPPLRTFAGLVLAITMGQYRWPELAELPLE
jgi:hypothetical protein